MFLLRYILPATMRCLAPKHQVNQSRMDGHETVKQNNGFLFTSLLQASVIVTEAGILAKVKNI